MYIVQDKMHTNIKKCLSVPHQRVRTPRVNAFLFHVSAGVGRTGTYLALDIILDQTQQEEEVNIFGVVKRMREDRCNMVQNKVIITMEISTKK